MIPNNTFYLIDGSSYIFRAFYAIAPLTTKDGFPTNALYGFTKMLIKLLKDKSPAFGAVVFDAGRETFRTAIYPAYKANRSECPVELVPQMPYFREISKVLGFYNFELKGYEADDIIGTLSTLLESQGYNVVIVSSDKDLLQLVTQKVKTFDPVKEKYFEEKEVVEKLGVKPNQVVDYLTLTGDASDNIPGVQGVGPKTATQLLQNYLSLDNILNNLENIREDKAIRNRNSVVDSFITAKEQIPISRKLAEVFKEVPLETFKTSDLTNDLKISEIDSEELNKLAKKFEFESLTKDLVIARPKSAEELNERYSKYLTITDSNFDSWITEFLKQKIYAIDLETTSLDPKEAKIVGIAICWSNDKAYYLPINHQEKGLSWEDFISKCRESVESPEIKKVGQNLKYDFEVFKANGINISGIYFDTMLASYLLDSERKSFSLDSLSNDFLNITPIKYEEITKDLENFSYLDINTATRYAAEDAHIAWLLYEYFNPKLKEENLLSLFNNIEMPIVEILGEMELNGILIDLNYLEALSREFGNKIVNYEVEIERLAGEKINLNSPKQLGELLFERLNIPTKGLKKTKSGYSTDSSVLEKLQKDFPIANQILEYRMYTKLKSTFIDALVKICSSRTKRIHASFHQTGTSTGRLSSSDPNLQNIPIQTSEGRRIRSAFIAPEGYSLITADYSQIELRILAEMSGDENLIETFKRDEDIHERTAREIFSLSVNDAVSKEQRRVGKTMNFGIIYGMGAYRLAKELGISFQEATSYIQLYFSRYPKVQELFLKLENDAYTKGYVETLFGRRRYLRNLDTSGRDDGFMARVAINAPLQGTAADLVKLAMISINKEIQDGIFALNKDQSSPSESPKLVLQIHDELVLECKTEDATNTTQLIKNIMENVVDWSVPLKVSASYKQNWGD